MLSKIEYKLKITVEGYQQDITHLKADETQVLVGVPINLQHKNKQMLKLFSEKIESYISKLIVSLLSLNDKSFRH